MKVALLFSHDPRWRPPGIDLVRLRALTQGLRARGIEAHILAPIPKAAAWRGLPLKPVAALSEIGAYDLVKTCYHQAIFMAAAFQGPLVARLVRVIDERHPARDRLQRRDLLRAQMAVSHRAQALAFNNVENHQRWQRLYGEGPLSVITPTGCPRRLPPLGPDPLGGPLPAVVYAGSLASPRQVGLLNRVAAALNGRALVHLVGRNKSGLYGRGRALSPLVVDHGEKPPQAVWDHLRWAAVGLALAVGPQPFDNDSSKVVHYLRAGLPVVCEEPILQGRLASELGIGVTLPYNDAQGLALALLDMTRQRPAPSTLRRARAFMARHHAWDNVVDAYLKLFSRLLGKGRAA